MKFILFSFSYYFILLCMFLFKLTPKTLVTFYLFGVEYHAYDGLILQIKQWASLESFD